MIVVDMFLYLQAVKFIEQGHVRVGPDTITDPAFLVTRSVNLYRFSHPLQKPKTNSILKLKHKTYPL